VSCTTPVSPPSWPNSSVPASVNYIVENRRRHIHVRLVMVFRTPQRARGAPQYARRCAPAPAVGRIEISPPEIPLTTTAVVLFAKAQPVPARRGSSISDLLPQPDAPKVVECREQHNIS
jgi:hypothetical protein